jgi:hypothetical protein
VEERKALGFKKSNHCRTRSLSCTSLAMNFCRQRFEQNWFVNHRCRRRPNLPPQCAQRVCIGPYASLNSYSDATRSCGSIKLLIRYRGRPPSSGSIALISYAPAAALGAAEGRR